MWKKIEQNFFNIDSTKYNVKMILSMTKRVYISSREEEY